jgi:hypothetical protein
MAARTQPGSNASGQPAELDLLRSLEAEQVRFRHIVTAWQRGHQARNGSAADYLALMPSLLEKFERTRGQVLSAQMYPTIRAVALLSDIDMAAERGGRAIHVDVAPKTRFSVDAQELLAGCADLQNRALLYLTPRPRKVCIGQLITLTTTLLAELEASDEPDQPRTKAMASMRAQLLRAENYYLAAVQRRARNRYASGTAVGIIPYAVALALLIVLSGDLLDSPRQAELLAVSTIAGAVGATISVLARLTSGRLILGSLEENSDRTLRQLGAVRPTVGAVFGVVLFLVVSSDIVPLELPAPPGNLFLFAAFGFVAGFSERFAQDALSRVEGSLPPGNAAAQPEERLLP